LFERSNFVLDSLFPDIGFIPPDRYPSYGSEVVKVQERLRQGMSVSAATKPSGVATGADTMAASNLLADRDEDFNTRLGSMRGWQMALERVKPIARHTAPVDLTAWAIGAECTTSRQVVELFASQFFAVELAPATVSGLATFLHAELGTDDIQASVSFLETPLRKLLHRMLSLPEYQLG
jgi:hypothetical protein